MNRIRFGSEVRRTAVGQQHIGGHNGMKGTAREERGQKGYEKPMIRVDTHQAYEMNAAYQQTYTFNSREEILRSDLHC